jgi:hypothetical protein
MVTSTSRLAYGDCYDLMDKAIADPKGIKIKFAQEGDASHFRIRLHTARKIDRLDNQITFEETHPMHGRSVYDVLTMRIKPTTNGTWLRLERIDAREFEIESLSEPEPEPELPMAAIRGPTEKIERHVVEAIRPQRLLRRL